MRKCAPILALCIGLSACTTAGINYAMDTYNDVPLVKFTDAPPGGTGRIWRIMDRPDGSKLMITPTIGSGIVTGATLGAVPNPEADQYRDAALRWLASTGRTCAATSTVKILPGQYEVVYQCPTPPAPEKPS